MFGLILIALAVMLVFGIALYAVGREIDLLATRSQPAVYELEEAVEFIADNLPEEVAGRITFDDVRWILKTDAAQLEAADDSRSGTEEESYDPVVDETDTIAVVLKVAEQQRPALTDDDVAAVLHGRMRYLVQIGAIGPPVED